MIELERRRVIHVAVTREPSSQWVAQQLRNATLDRDGPQYLVRDRDAKFGAEFDRAAKLMDIDIVWTAPRSLSMNAHYERFLRSVKRECLDHVLVVGERQLLRVLREYITYFNEQRPHQGMGQKAYLPLPPTVAHRAAQWCARRCSVASIIRMGGPPEGRMNQVASTGGLRDDPPPADRCESW